MKEIIGHVVRLIALIAIIFAVIVGGALLLFKTTDGKVSSEPIGYAIVMHEDGEEQVEVYGCYTENGTIICTTEDGGQIISNDITVILY